MSSTKPQTVVVVIDSDRDRGRSMICAFANCDCATVYLWRDGRGQLQMEGQEDALSHCVLLLWHVGDLAGTWPQIRAKLTVYYSGSGGNSDRFPTNTQERIWRSVNAAAATPGSSVLNPIEAQVLLSYAYNLTEGNQPAEKPTVLRQESAYLPALALLCQGYLATYAKAHMTEKDGNDSVMTAALDEMGWTGVHTQLTECPNWKQQRETVRSAGWWLDVFGAKAAVSQLVQQEWQNRENCALPPAVVALLEQIEAGVPIESPQLVADVFYAIHC